MLRVSTGCCQTLYVELSSDEWYTVTVAIYCYKDMVSCLSFYLHWREVKGRGKNGFWTELGNSYFSTKDGHFIANLHVHVNRLT